MTRRRAAARRRFYRFVESLESRVLLSTYTPAQIRNAYGFDQIAADGTGQTIAIVNAYNNTNVAADLDVFNQRFSTVDGGPSLFTQYGPAANFLTVTTLGDQTRFDSGWGMESSLDVQWAHAIAPGAKIVLVQANSAKFSDMIAAVDHARSLPSVSVISMSWGAGEFRGQRSLDVHFTTPKGHKGITFVAASGDDGAGAGWPAIAANVLAVGGTTLNLGNGYLSETAWYGSGGGYSSYVAKPAYQKSVNSTGKRSNPDVAYNADSNTGFYVYDSNYYGQSGWFSVGGTSAGTPQWAALVALANQLRGSAGPLTTAQTLSKLYTMPATNFHDIVGGSNGFAATAGYDLATGRGSPIAPLVVASLADPKTASATNATAPPKTKASTKKSIRLRAAWSYELQGSTAKAAPTPAAVPAVATFTEAPALSRTKFSATISLAAPPEMPAALQVAEPVVSTVVAGARLPAEARAEASADETRHENADHPLTECIAGPSRSEQDEEEGREEAQGQ